MKAKSIILALFSLFLVYSANAQPTQTLCNPANEDGCFSLGMHKEITLPQYPHCSFEVMFNFTICNGEFYIQITSFKFPEDGGCDALISRMNQNGVIDYEFLKWFEKQAFYYTAIAVFTEMRENQPWNPKFYCPDGLITFTGFFGQCNADAMYKMPDPFCIGRYWYWLWKEDCTGLPCCELRVKICADPNNNYAINITESASPIPGQCDAQRPLLTYPRGWQLEWYTECYSNCTDLYPYSSPAPGQ